MTGNAQVLMEFADRLERHARGGGVHLLLDAQGAVALAHAMRQQALSLSYMNRRREELEAEMDYLSERKWLREFREERATRAVERQVPVWLVWLEAAFLSVLLTFFLIEAVFG